MKGKNKYIDFGLFREKSVGELKASLYNLIREAYIEGYEEVNIKGWGNIIQFINNINNDSFIIPASSWFTLRVSNIIIIDKLLYASIEILSYWNNKYIWSIQADSFKTDYIQISDKSQIDNMKDKLSSLEARIQALENK